MKEIAKVNILGTPYEIIQCEGQQENDNNLARYRSGECDSMIKVIYVADLNDTYRFGNIKEAEKPLFYKEVLRHELLHAFLNESGLRYNTENSTNGWATNEEMIDWFAIQSPKIIEVYKQLKIDK